VIAEIKRRSPSKGTLDASIDAAERARRYEEAGAAALSVLTEPEHFGGSLDDLARAAASVRIPILRKDFLVDPLQLLEARALGASAGLLIARALPPGDLERMVAAGNDAGLELLVEVRDDAELERAVLAGARIIGVNTRNLETLEIDEAIGRRLVRQVPAGVVAVYESGIADRAGVERAAAAGADAVLVGSALSAAGDPGAMLRSLVGVPGAVRGD
jgi:indole-3-glycerol phosphate synthase